MSNVVTVTIKIEWPSNSSFWNGTKEEIQVKKDVQREIIQSLNLADDYVEPRKGSSTIAILDLPKDKKIFGKIIYWIEREKFPHRIRWFREELGV